MQPVLLAMLEVIPPFHRLTKIFSSSSKCYSSHRTVGPPRLGSLSALDLVVAVFLRETIHHHSREARQ